MISTVLKCVYIIFVLIYYFIDLVRVINIALAVILVIQALSALTAQWLFVHMYFFRVNEINYLYLYGAENALRR